MKKLNLLLEKIAESGGARAEVEINEGGLLTYNDPFLTKMMEPSLQRTVGISNAIVVAPTNTGRRLFILP